MMAEAPPPGVRPGPVRGRKGSDKIKFISYKLDDSSMYCTVQWLKVYDR